MQNGIGRFRIWLVAVSGACALLVADAARAQGMAGDRDRLSFTLLPGQMVREVTLAHDAGVESDVVHRWRGRVGSGTPAAALLEGTLARLAFRYDEAERLYEAAASDTGGLVGAWATLGLASVGVSRQGYGGVLRTFAHAAERMRQHGDRHGEVEARLGQTVALLRVRGVDSARAILGGVAVVIPRDDPQLRARAQCVAMQVRQRAGERLADSTWARVLDAAAPHGRRLNAECRFLRAQYLESVGLASAARTLLDTVADLQFKARIWNGLSATRQWQGTALLARGQHAPARAALNEALVYARRGASANGEAWALQELGRVAQRVGATGDALRFFRRARPLFLASGDETGLLLADRALADAALLRRDVDTADSLYAGFVARAERLLPQQRVPVLVAQSEVARSRGQFTVSEQLLDSATLLARSRNLPGWASEIRYHRGLVALATGLPSAAIAQWDTLLRSQNLRAPVRFEILSRWAEAQSLAGRFDAAWRTFGLAKRALDGWTSGLARREDALALLQDRDFDWDRDLGLATLIARFAAADRVAEALAMAEWRRLRGREQAALQRGALQIDASRPAGVLLHQVDTTALDPRRLPALARGRLSPSVAVVSFVVGVGNEPTSAFVISRDTVVSVRLAPIDSLRAPIERFVGFLRAGQWPAPLARLLSDAVLAPVIATLPSGVQRLVIVPDGELHRLPFAALAFADGGDGLQRHEIAIAPSVDDALGSVAVVTRPGTRRRGDDVLLVGAPARMPQQPGSDESWPDLPGARAEVRSVRALLRGTTVLDGDRATRARLAERLLLGGTVLHVATHAVADPTSFEGNGLVVTASKADTEPGLFDLPALSAQPLPFDLVVFSACSSGDGALLTGQALHGLVSTALDAGARGVVATRWRLDDAVIVPHMQRFYTELLAGRDVVAALHTVRVEAARAGVSPAIWANLEYFGDPTLRVTLSRQEPTAWSRLSGAVRQWLRALRGGNGA